jgi:hypothetical protein
MCMPSSYHDSHRAGDISVTTMEAQGAPCISRCCTSCFAAGAVTCTCQLHPAAVSHRPDKACLGACFMRTVAPYIWKALCLAMKRITHQMAVLPGACTK